MRVGLKASSLMCRMRDMTPEDFRQWRSAMGMTQQQAAGMLGLSKSTIELYESGKRRDNDQPVEIPRVVALACAALRREVGDDPWLESRVRAVA